MNENLEEDIITQIYYNELNGIYDLPKGKEYTNITNKIRMMEKKILQDNKSKEIKQYMEYINERSSIEAEEQFRIGFKTAVKIILEGLK